MIPGFGVKRLPHIFFGNEKIRELPKITASFGNSALILRGAQSLEQAGLWQNITDSLNDSGIHYSTEQIDGEPSPAMVDSIVSKYGQRSGFDAVIGIGGGAVIDAGKAVSAMLPGGESVVSFLEGIGTRETDGKKVPFIAVPTTAGTGSETTSNAVLSQVGENGYKKSLRHDNYIPDVALIDPSLTASCPRHVTTNCAMDAFTQLVESYLSSKASPFTDDLALGAIMKIENSLFRLCRGEGDLSDRGNMSYAACVSGITLANAGLGIVHGFASVIGGRYMIPHGVVCGTLMAPANEITLVRLRKEESRGPGLAKYARLGQIFMKREGASSEYYQDGFIDVLKQLSCEIPLDLLSDYGIEQSDVTLIAAKSGTKNNPVSLNHDEMEAILSARIA